MKYTIRKVMHTICDIDNNTAMKDSIKKPPVSDVILVIFFTYYGYLFQIDILVINYYFIR